MKLNEIFDAKTPIEEVSGSSLNETFINPEYGVLDAYYLQICQGCVNHCSYCAIKKAKGHVTSKPIATIVRELQKGISLGFDRFMILGDDCGSYGADIGVDLADLLAELNKYDIRLLFNYIEPGAFLKLLKKVERSVFAKIDFMNIPVQSVAERILKMMNRNYATTEVVAAVRELKQAFPQLYLETHVIFAFPGETRHEFRQTLEMAEVFDALIYFYYTDRKNVKAAELPDKIDTAEIRFRAKEITRHPRFTWEYQSAKPPLVLLGYGPDSSELFTLLDLPAVADDAAQRTVA